MSQRTDIVTSLISHISTSTSSTGFRGYRFLHEINSFPSFYIAFQNESRIHKGAGSVYSIIALNLRGYCWSDALESIEVYMRELEVAIQTYRPQHLRFVDEARVVSVRTDEGVMQPYGVVDLNLEVLYQVIPNYVSGITADSTIITVDTEQIKVDQQ